MLTNAKNFIDETLKPKVSNFIKDLSQDDNEPKNLVEVPIQTEKEKPVLKSILDELELDRFVIRSFREMFDTSSFNYPIEKVSDRIYNNLQYYGANYALILFLFLSYLCITNPLFLVCVASGLFIYKKHFNMQWLSGCIIVSFFVGGTTLIIFSMLGGGTLVLHSILKNSPYIPQENLSKKSN